MSQTCEPGWVALSDHFGPHDEVTIAAGDFYSDAASYTGSDPWAIKFMNHTFTTFEPHPQTLPGNPWWT